MVEHGAGRVGRRGEHQTGQRCVGVRRVEQLGVGWNRSAGPQASSTTSQPRVDKMLRYAG